MTENIELHGDEAADAWFARNGRPEIRTIERLVDELEANLVVKGKWTDVEGYDDAVVVVERSSYARDCDGPHESHTAEVFDLKHAVKWHMGPSRIAYNTDGDGVTWIDRYDLLELVADNIEFDDVTIGALGDTLQDGEVVDEEIFQGSDGGPAEEGSWSVGYVVRITRRPEWYVHEHYVRDVFAEQAGY